MPDVEVVMSALKANRTAEGEAENLEVTFNVNATISESDRSDGLMKLKYSIDLETSPLPRGCTSQDWPQSEAGKKSWRSSWPDARGTAHRLCS